MTTPAPDLTTLAARLVAVEALLGALDGDDWTRLVALSKGVPAASIRDAVHAAVSQVGQAPTA